MKVGCRVVGVVVLLLRCLLSVSALLPSVQSRLPAPTLVFTRWRRIPQVSVSSFKAFCVFNPPRRQWRRVIDAGSSSYRNSSKADFNSGISTQRSVAPVLNTASFVFPFSARTLHAFLVGREAPEFLRVSKQVRLKNSILSASEQSPHAHSPQKEIRELSAEGHGTDNTFRNKPNAIISEFSGISPSRVEAGNKAKTAPKVLQISDAAHKKLMDMRGNGSRLHLRLGVKSGGCSGLSYNLTAITESELTDSDHVERFDFGAIAIDPQSFFYVFGTVLDYSEQLMGGGFRVKNPNASKTCGCGQSFGVPKDFIHKHIESKPTKCSEK